MTRPARDAAVTPRRVPRRRTTEREEATVEGRLVLTIDEDVREAVAEALAALLLVVAEREELTVLADASQ